MTNLNMSSYGILYQKFDFIAVDKKAGDLVHQNEDPECLVAKIEKKLKIEKLYPVHRLDKETSGVQILSLQNEAAIRLTEQFQTQNVKKIYTGIIKGQLREQQGVWDWPLTDRSEGRKNPQGHPNERIPCQTKYKVIVRTQYFSICEFELLTMCHHQIRKHVAMTNHPIVGDSRYGDPNYNEKIMEIYKTDRMFLHCSRIEIENQVIESPTPEIFFQLMQDGAVGRPNNF